MLRAIVLYTKIKLKSVLHFAFWIYVFYVIAIYRVDVFYSNLVIISSIIYIYILNYNFLFKIWVYQIVGNVVNAGTVEEHIYIFSDCSSKDRGCGVM